MSEGKLDPDAIRADMEAGTPGPWSYRPHEYTDWGEVYAGEFRICQARDPSAMRDEVLREHRRSGADPWGANARRIARLPDLEPGYLDAIEENTALRAENARLQAVDRWQPIETARRDERRVLLYAPSYGPSTGHYDQAVGWRLHSVLNREAVPTHWQPLDGPPAALTPPNTEGEG